MSLVYFSFSSGGISKIGNTGVGRYFQRRFPSSFQSDIKNEQKQEQQEDCPNILKGGLAYDSNTCYMDSVLMILFVTLWNHFKKILDVENYPVKYQQQFCERRTKNEKGVINVDVLPDDQAFRDNIKQEMKMLAEEIREGKISNCRNLRVHLRNCPNKSFQNFFETNMQDASDFLLYLFQMFELRVADKEEINFDTVDNFNTYQRNHFQTDSNKFKDIPYVSISLGEIMEKGSYFTSQSAINHVIPNEKLNLIQQGNKDVLVTGKITIINVIDTPFLTIGINRYNEQMEFNIFPIVVTDEVTLENGKKLNLGGVVCFENAHYWSYFKCGDQWFYFNDISTTAKVQPIENGLEQKFDQDKTSRATLLFYC